MNINIHQRLRLVSLPSHGRGHRFNPCRAHQYQALSGPLGNHWRAIGALTIALLLAAPAHAEPPDIADLVGVHQEMRRAATIPEYDWPLRDGVWDCEDNARWARALLEARGWPRERLGIYLGLDVWGRPHAVLCASGEGLDEPICLDRVWSSVVPLSAYGSGWRQVDLP